LSHGAALFVLSQHELDQEVLLKYVVSHKITFIKATPSFLKGIVKIETESDERYCDTLRFVMFGGEAINIDDAKLLCKKYPALLAYNHYGPTECTIGCICHKLDINNININGKEIGRPISNTRSYILGSNHKLLPKGACGELYIAGEGVGIGYLNNPELTSSVFIDSSFEDRKMYCTGDYARFTNEGKVEFLGRVDQQVKIRGYRVELREIELVLLSYKAVREAVVVAKNKDNEFVLVAFITGSERIYLDDVRSFLISRLPNYMVPLYISLLDEMPITTSGKIDRRQLSNVSLGALLRDTVYVGARDSVEEGLSEIWRDVLGLDQVGIHDNFFSLGGHSLKVIRVSGQINKKFGVKLSLRDLFQYCTISSQSDLVRGGKRESYQAVVHIEDSLDYELSHAQKRLWILDQLESSQVAYNMHSSYELEGVLDVDALEWSLKEVMLRHESLRTIITTDSGGPRQRVVNMEDTHWSIEYHSFEAGDDSSVVKDLVSGFVGERFDLKSGPLFRVLLVKLSQDRHLFVMLLHHIISDGWSMRILFRELLMIYNHRCCGVKMSLSPVVLQYRDYSHWQHQALQRADWQVHGEYWREVFSGWDHVLHLPTDYPRPVVKTYRGEEVVMDLDSSLSEALRSYNHRHGVTLFMTMQAAVKVLLYRYSGQSDITIGTTVAGREQQELEDQVGFYVNTIALRSRFKSSDSFNDLVRQVRDTTLEGYTHQQYPFDLLVEELDIVRDPGRSPLFDVLVELLNLDAVGVSDPEGIRINNFDTGFTVSKYDLSFRIMDTDVLQVIIEYNTDIYSRWRVEQMMNHYRHILEQVCQDGNCRLDELDYLSDVEKYKLIEGNNSTTREYASGFRIEELIGIRSEQWKDSIALQEGDDRLSYADLVSRSRRLSHQLKDRYGIREGDAVGIVLGNSIHQVIGILGVLGSGAVFVPVDRAHPSRRKSYILEDSGCVLVLTDSSQMLDISDYYSGPLLVMDVDSMEEDGDFYSWSGGEGVEGWKRRAYILYTSGTSGWPKGVCISHANLLNYLEWCNAYYFLGDRGYDFAFFTSLSFDLTLTSLFSTLLRGDTVHIYEGSSMEETLSSIFSSDHIKAVKLTPTHISLLGHLGITHSGMRVAIVGGEALNAKQVSILSSLGDVRIYNEYGPTETTVGCSVWLAGDEEAISIGEPIGNSRIYILDHAGRLVGTGINGEIFISGAGVGEGYLNQPELTAKKFVKDPYHEGEMMYGSGDKGRWGNDGKLEYLGRLDTQVKVRGYRIELTAIEEVILRDSRISAAVVHIDEGNSAENRSIVAYLVSSIEVDIESLRLRLSEELPFYMLPSYYVKLDTLPMTVNGKVDRSRLPSISHITSPVEQLQTAQTDTERGLISIWQNILDRNDIGVTSNFFHLGGHSLKAVQMLSRIYEEFHVRLDLSTIFRNPNIRELGRLLESSRVAEYHHIVPITGSRSYYDVSHAQRRIWLMTQLGGDRLAYNISSRYEFRGALDRSSFERAFGTLLERHEILRTTIVTVNGEPYQKIHSYTDYPFTMLYHDLRDDADGESQLLTLIESEGRTAFDLAEGPLLRAQLVHVSDQHYAFLLTIHHIISDGWSMNIMIREVMDLYNGYCMGSSVDLTPLRVQYKDYVAWQQQQLQGSVLSSHRNYWQQQLSGPLPVLKLATDYPRPQAKTYAGNCINFTMDGWLGEDLYKLGQRHDSTLFMTLLSGMNVLLYCYTGQQDIVIGTPVTLRDHQDLEGQLGNYLNTIALRTRFNEEDSFEILSGKVRQITLQGFEHQSYPFDSVIEDLNLNADRSRNPLFDIGLNFNNVIEVDRSGSEQLMGIDVQAIESDLRTVKSDIWMNVTETRQGIEFSIDYNIDLFSHKFMENFIHDYTFLLQQVVHNPSIRLKVLRYMITEQQTLQKKENQKKIKDKNYKSLVNLKLKS
jgi:amino acid adenylation domain-containing protein